MPFWYCRPLQESLIKHLLHIHIWDFSCENDLNWAGDSSTVVAWRRLANQRKSSPCTSYVFLLKMKWAVTLHETNGSMKCKNTNGYLFTAKIEFWNDHICYREYKTRPQTKRTFLIRLLVILTRSMSLLLLNNESKLKESVTHNVISHTWLKKTHTESE